VKNSELAAELERIRALDPEGKLRPRTVVDLSEDKNHPLHDYFDWDNELAGDKWRLAQARGLIRVVVTVLPTDDRPVRAYHSLRGERSPPEEDDELGSTGSYRPLQEIVSNDAMRAMLLHDALCDLQTLQNKYQQLVELAGVFEAAREVRVKATETKSKAKATTAKAKPRVRRGRKQTAR